MTNPTDEISIWFIEYERIKKTYEKVLILKLLTRF